MGLIDWKQDYSVGVEQIDQQHKHFMDILNRLYIIVQKAESDKVSPIIDELVTYTKEHFDTEERYFKEFKYDKAKEHIAEHRRLSAAVNGFILREDQDPLNVSFELLDFLENWLIMHLYTMDKEYTKCFNEHGLY